MYSNYPILRSPGCHRHSDRFRDPDYAHSYDPEPPGVAEAKAGDCEHVSSGFNVRYLTSSQGNT